MIGCFGAIMAKAGKLLPVRSSHLRFAARRLSLVSVVKVLIVVIEWQAFRGNEAHVSGSPLAPSIALIHSQGIAPGKLILGLEQWRAPLFL